MNYLKIGKAADLTGKERLFYRLLEIFPGALSWGVLLVLVFFSFLKPVWVAYFIIIFDIYWLLLVLYLSIHLFASYFSMKKAEKINWRVKLDELENKKISGLPENCLARQGFSYKDIIHLIIVPTLIEPLEILRPEIQSIINDGFPVKQMIYNLALEEREGEKGQVKAQKLKEEFGHYFRNFIITTHPDGLVGEIKGKGANQAYAARLIKKEIIDKEGLDYDKI
ncbi:MAG: hypothetical protein WC415_04805 [Patescibacteria group bacterium]|jgi:hypothetical protein